MTLAEFVAARLADDRDTADGLAEQYAAMGSHIEGADRIRLHALLHHTAMRMLREVEAGRKILALHTLAGRYWCSCDEPQPCTTVRQLAAIWSDHPDYDPAWATP
jgi:hypothetical protein